MSQFTQWPKSGIKTSQHGKIHVLLYCTHCFLEYLDWYLNLFCCYESHNKIYTPLMPRDHMNICTMQVAYPRRLHRLNLSRRAITKLVFLLATISSSLLLYSDHMTKSIQQAYPPASRKLGRAFEKKMQQELWLPVLLLLSFNWHKHW